MKWFNNVLYAVGVAATLNVQFLQNITIGNGEDWPGLSTGWPDQMVITTLGETRYHFMDLAFYRGSGGVNHPIAISKSEIDPSRSLQLTKFPGIGSASHYNLIKQWDLEV